MRFLFQCHSFDILKTNIVNVFTNSKYFFTFFSFQLMNNNVKEEVIPLTLQHERREEREPQNPHYY